MDAVEEKMYQVNKASEKMWFTFIPDFFFFGSTFLYDG